MGRRPCYTCAVPPAGSTTTTFPGLVSVTQLVRASSLLLCLTLFLLPWVGVGTGVLLTGRAHGIGVQPAFLTGALLLVLLVLGSRRPELDGDAWVVIAASFWTLLTTAVLWRLDQLGVAGETPWLKGAKQALVLFFLVGLACAPAVHLARIADKGAEIARWERAASSGLLLAAGFGVLQAIHFYAPLPGGERVAAWAASNPSIAAGSQELYLGHRFVGIPRISGPACEPLYFGSYLLAVVPVAGMAALRSRGWSRGWRVVAAGLGTLCLIMTFSRGVYLGMAVIGAGLAVGWRWGRVRVERPRRVLAGLLLGSVLLASLAAPLTGMAPWQIPGLLLSRLAQSFQAHDMSNLTRLYAWKAGWIAFLRAPWMGIGWGGFGFWFYELVPEGAGAHFGWPVTNSLPLRFLAETGAVGAGLWSFAARPAFAGLRPGSSSTGDTLSFFLSLLCVAAVFQTLTFSQLQLPHFWLLLGVTAAWTRGGFRLV